MKQDGPHPEDNLKSPSPESPPRRQVAKQGALSSLVEAEKLMQIAFLIPAATVVGWLIGVGLDHSLHQTWIYIAGLIFGAIAGFVQMFRTVLEHMKD